MKHIRFSPVELSRGMGNRPTTHFDRGHKKMLSGWAKDIEARGTSVSVEALRKALVCYAHGRSSGTRDEALNYYMECVYAQDGMVIDVWPLRDKPDAQSYIGI